MKIQCPRCDQLVPIDDLTTSTELSCPSCGHTFELGSFLTSELGEETVSTRASEWTQANPIGQHLGHFVVLKKIGHGGFGTVFQAHDTLLEQIVAIKVPRQGRFTKMQSELFVREARIAAHLRDVPNIVPVHEIGQEDDFVYIVSSFIDGRSLTQWRRAKRRSINELLQIFEKILIAIEKAHEKGVVHRDLKPNNIIVDSKDEPFITDFGLASHESGEQGTIAKKGDVLGTIPYLSPEQVRGDSNLADRRSDIYSLGTILYELLTDEKPFESNSTSVFEEILTGEFKAPRELNESIPAELERICLKAMRVERSERYANIAEFLNDLQEFLHPASDEKALSRRTALIAGVSIIATGGLAWAGSRWFQGEPLLNDDRVKVQIESTPPWKKLAVVPLDPTDGTLLYDKMTRINKPQKFVRLQPGRHYLIEAQSADGSFVLVQRFVPPVKMWEQGKGGGAFNHNSWEVQNNVPVMPEITLKRHRISEATQAMIVDTGSKGNSIQLSRITTGVNNEKQEILKGSIAPGYYLGQTEVTFGQYMAVMPGRPTEMDQKDVPPSDNFPIVKVSRDEQLSFCEKTGLNLMTLQEYEFAQSNGGESRFPWGDTIPKGQVYRLSKVGIPEFDVTTSSRITPPVRGLNSGVMEATFESNPGVSLAVKQASLGIQYPIVGGSLKVLYFKSETVEADGYAISLGEFRDELATPGSSAPITESGMSMAKLRSVGFRVSKPATPRFID